MFFNRYEIRIQAFVDFIIETCIICRSSSPQKYIGNIYTENIYIYFLPGASIQTMMLFTQVQSAAKATVKKGDGRD